MPRTCTICRHGERVDIDKALVTRTPFRDIAGRHGVSKSALVRHHDDHLPASLVRAQRAQEAAQADELLAQVLDLRDRAERILDAAEADKNWTASTGAIREWRACLELLGKLAGQLAAAPTINIIMSAEFQAVQAGILAALRPYPDARLAVSAALETHHEPGHA